MRGDQPFQHQSLISKTTQSWVFTQTQCHCLHSTNRGIEHETRYNQNACRNAVSHLLLTELTPSSPLLIPYGCVPWSRQVSAVRTHVRRKAARMSTSPLTGASDVTKSNEEKWESKSTKCKNTLLFLRFSFADIFRNKFFCCKLWLIAYWKINASSLNM